MVPRTFVITQMLEKPDLADEFIVDGVQAEYGLAVAELAFLPLGLDVSTAVYRMVCGDGRVYFLKLRKGAFDPVTVRLPRFLRHQAIQAVIAPLETRGGQLWGSLDGFTLILYPFIEGRNGYEQRLSDSQWVVLGSALKKIHDAALPPELAGQVPGERFSPEWRELVKQFQAQVEDAAFGEPVAARLAQFMRTRSDEIRHIVKRAEQLASGLQASAPDFVLCHADLHPGNLLIGAEDELYIVDWDNPIFALKERDLMFAGAGMSGSRYQYGPREEALFYQGYGPAQVDPAALAYYRYERIVQDMAEFCKQLFWTDAGGQDREEAYAYFTGQFLPGQEVDKARQVDPGG